jgi:simple sugar transport system ATP-binding protein
VVIDGGEREHALEVRDLSKSYGAVQALRNVSFTLDGGEVLGLLGDNGAGKSTMVKCLSGMLVPDAGQIIVHGDEMKLDDPTAARRAGIETVHQDLALARYLDVASNIYLNRERTTSWPILRWLGWLDKRAMYKETRAALNRLNVRVPSVRMLTEQLSGGQRQAVAVSRAVAWSRDIVLLDEPTAALGVQQSSVVLDLIRRMRDEGIAIVLVSHNMQHVVDVCTRAIVLRIGGVAGDVSIADVTASDLVDLITGARTAQSGAQTRTGRPDARQPNDERESP